VHFDTGIVDDEYVDTGLAEGWLVKWDSRECKPRRHVLAELRARVRAWRKPALRQESAAPVFPTPTVRPWNEP